MAAHLPRPEEETAPSSPRPRPGITAAFHWRRRLSEGRAFLRPHLVPEEVGGSDPERRRGGGWPAGPEATAPTATGAPCGGLSPVTGGGHGSVVPALPPAWDDRGGPLASAPVRGPGTSYIMYFIFHLSVTFTYILMFNITYSFC